MQEDQRRHLAQDHGRGLCRSLRRMAAWPALLAAALVLSACGQSDSPALEGGAGSSSSAPTTREPGSTADPPTDAGPEVAPKVTAVGTAFEPSSLLIGAGKTVSITFDNRDAGVPHNLHVHAPARGGELKTDVRAGPAVQVLTVSIDQPGTYVFECDVHRSQMKGTLVVR